MPRRFLLHGAPYATGTFRALALFLVAATHSVLVTPSVARAHGRLLGVTQVQVLSDGRLATFTTRGPVLETRDGDGSSEFPWTCSQGYGDSGQLFIPLLATDDVGTLLAATLAGVYRRPHDGCAWEQVQAEALRFTAIGDVVASAAGGGRFYAVTAEPLPSNVVARSDDRGLTWSTAPIDNARLQSVRDAPSDESRVYAAGFQEGDGQVEGTELNGVIATSIDGGMSFGLVVVPFIDGERTLVVDAVAPDDAGIAYVRTVTTRRDDAPVERLMMYRGGEAHLLLTSAQIRGVAAGPGGVLWAITESALLRLQFDPAQLGPSGGPADLVTTELRTDDYTAIAFGGSSLYVAPQPTTGAMAVIGDATMLVELEYESGASRATVSRFTDITEPDRCDDPVNDPVCARDFQDVLDDSALLVSPPAPTGAGGGCSVTPRGDVAPIAYSIVALLAWAAGWQRRRWPGRRTK